MANLVGFEERDTLETVNLLYIDCPSQTEGRRYSAIMPSHCMDLSGAEGVFRDSVR
jgi:hypothetical protein